MRRSVSIKIAVLLPVILITRLVTSEIMARNIMQDSQKTPTLTKTLVDPTNPQVLSKRQKIAKPVSASYQLTGQSFLVQGNEVHVMGSVDMMSRSRRTAHLWRLRIFRESDGVLEMDKPYADQIFEMHPSGHMSPTFSETIQLPPGDHRVILSLYGVPKGYDLAELNDQAKALAALLIEIPKVVKIP